MGSPMTSVSYFFAHAQVNLLLEMTIKSHRLGLCEVQSVQLTCWYKGHKQLSNPYHSRYIGKDSQ